MTAARIKEWQNWIKYSDVKEISKEELQELKKQNESLRVIPTRWVDVNKAEPHEEPVYKGRLVVRGDLEDPELMRTDSPTGSAAMLNTVFCLSAARDSDIKTGDISAAFLQGSQLDRILVLSAPRGGIPDEDGNYSQEERFFLVSSTVYGTKDAPRGWFKVLDKTVKEEGLKPIPYEPASYTLVGPHGELQGMLVIHVDDMIWTGGDAINAVMDRVCQRFKFGKLETNRFRFCGREVSKTPDGVSITCPNLTDRVKPIYLKAEDRKNPTKPVTEEIRGQLRSIIGSLAWLARVCRPDLAYAVCRMQSTVHCAVMDDVRYANTIVKFAQRTKDKGLFYPSKCFEFENLMLVAVQDASHAADFDVSSSGNKMGHRSQSGRILFLADKDFKVTRRGVLLPVEWHSTVLKRVCRSTLQAETLSLLHGSEEADHYRYSVYGMWHPDGRGEAWEIDALDNIEVDWITDCHSLWEHANRAGLSVVNDKRLAIDLSGIRQSVWRMPGELLGDPLRTDRISAEATTRLLWTSTDKMLADPLTKGMKHDGLDRVMQGLPVDLTPTKVKECENEGDMQVSIGD